MGLLDETLEAIRPLDEEAMRRVRTRWRHLYLGMGGLGKMEDMAVQYAGAVGTDAPDIPKRCMVIASADHGIARHGGDDEKLPRFQRSGGERAGGILQRGYGGRRYGHRP